MPPKSKKSVKGHCELLIDTKSEKCIHHSTIPTYICRICRICTECSGSGLKCLQCCECSSWMDTTRAGLSNADIKKLSEPDEYWRCPPCADQGVDSYWAQVKNQVKNSKFNDQPSDQVKGQTGLQASQSG